MKHLATLVICLAIMLAGGKLITGQRAQKLTRSNLPIVDYDSTKNVDRARQEKNLKYNRPGLTKSLKDNEAVEELLPINAPWMVGLSAIPADKSDVIIIGRVVDRKAFISEDKKAVYSELSFKVESVLKGDQVSQDDITSVTRYGGAVRFQSGKIHEFRFAAQGFPATNKRYILFLKRDQNDLLILTGYQLMNGFVTPIDGSPEMGMVFEKYRGVEEPIFLKEVSEVISKGGR